MAIIGTLKIDSAVCLICSFNLVLDASLFSLVYDVNASVPTLGAPVIAVQHQSTFPWKGSAESPSEGAPAPHISLVCKELSIPNTIYVGATEGVGSTWPFGDDPVFSRSVEVVLFKVPKPQDTFKMLVNS